MNKTDLNHAVNFALNNFKAPRLRIHNIKLRSDKQYKVRCSEIDEDGFTVRCTLYFDESFIKKCLQFYNRGVRQWGEI